MRYRKHLAAFFSFFFLGTAIIAQSIRGGDGITLPTPPQSNAIPVVDNYFGTKVVDNYRWLEDSKSSETRAFIDTENAYTSRYMKQARIRQQLVEDLDALENIAVTRVPIERAGSYFFERRMAGEQQFSIYVQHGWGGTAAEPERVIDPAVLSRDLNTSIVLRDVSHDGSLLTYAVQKGGADETSIHIFNLKTRKALEDELPEGRYLSISFAPDGRSFYYSRNSRQGTLVYQHVLGTRVSNDTLLFGREFHGELLEGNDLIFTSVSDDGRYLILQINRGVPARRIDIVFRDLTKPTTPFDILVWGMDSRFDVIYAKGSWYVKTDYQAPKGRILKADPGILPDEWKTVVPEGVNAIADWSIVNNRIYVARLKDVVTETSVYTLEGASAGMVRYEGMGTASGIYGRTTDRYGFFSFDSLIQPPTIYRLDTVTGKREVFAQTKIPFDTTQYELKQVFFPSKDGTRVPMFIAAKKGLKLDGEARLLMTGYGGFNVNMQAHWSPLAAWWIERGGWYALTNLRGGGEYGESWHEQGMFEKKQNVFDDWFAAAEYLIANKYTSPQHFAIMGTSNGGLLMGASMTQRPDLFAAILCGYPLLDMLRFQKFLVGAYWVTEYGSAENEKQFPYLLKYSPYQNVKAGTKYPSILFFTGDSDTRVDPLHARKMTALMQGASASRKPILLHYSLAGGHSGGMSVDQQVQDDSDKLTFLWTESSGREQTR